MYICRGTSEKGEGGWMVLGTMGRGTIISTQGCLKIHTLMYHSTKVHTSLSFVCFWRAFSHTHTADERGLCNERIPI